jgi:hypothetical protein
MIGFILPVHSHNSALQAIQRYRFSTHFPVHRCTSTRVLSLHLSYPGNGFIIVCHFKSHMKSSLHSLIPILLFFLKHLWLCPFITLRQGPHGKHRLLLLRICVYWPVTLQWMFLYCRVRVCCGNVFTDSLPSNWCTHHNIEQIHFVFMWDMTSLQVYRLSIN